MVREKEETTRTNAALKVEYEQKEVQTSYQKSAETDIVSEMELGNQKKDKNMTLKRDIKPTVTEVLDAYYDLNEPVEEPFDDAEFGSNEEQENGLKVLLKEVATECNALIRKLAPREKEPIQEPVGEINVRNNKNNGVKVEMELDPSEEKKEENVETVSTKPEKYLDNKARTESDRKTVKEGSVKERRGSKRPLDGDALGHACNLWMRKVIKFRGIVKKKENHKPKEVTRYLDDCGPYKFESEKKYEKEALESGRTKIKIEKDENEACFDSSRSPQLDDRKTWALLA
ncbi:9760_t:CDS:1, partial [Gigaspora margarita]